MGKFLKNKRAILFLIFLGIFIAGSVLALEPSGLELKWPPSPGTQITLTVSTPLPKLVQYFYEWGIALGGLAVFIALIIAGFQYLTSVGEPARMKEAMDRIKSAVLGLALLLASWLILNAINPELTALRLPPTNLAEIGQLECNVIGDCCDKYSTTTTPTKNECLSNPLTYFEKCTDENQDNNLKEGVCKMKEKKRVVCQKAQVFEDRDYETPVMWIEIRKKGEWPGGVRSVKVYADPGEVTKYAPKAQPEIEIEPKTGKEWANCCSEDANKNGYYGCGCFLQVAPRGGFLGWGCGDVEAIVPGCEKRIDDYVDEYVKCFKLIGSSWEIK